MLKTIVIDDEIHSREDINYFLQSHDFEVTGSFSDTKLAYSFILQNKPDIIFLDIDMPEENGIELALRIQQAIPEIVIIFITAYPKFALEAYRAYPFDFLLKPLDEERFNFTIDQLKKRIHLKDTHNNNSDYFIRTFGRFSVFRGGIEISFPTQKSREMLAYILCNYNSMIYKDEIIEALFGEYDAVEKNVNNMRVSLFRLKRTLEENGLGEAWIRIKSNYSIQVKDGLCDFIDFSRSLQRFKTIDNTNISLALGIAETLNGELLNDIDALWVSEKREWVAEKSEELLLKISLYYIDIEDFSKAEKYLLQLLDINEYSESGHIQLLDLYILVKNNTKFNYYYKIYYKIMREELRNPIDIKYLNHYKKINSQL